MEEKKRGTANELLTMRCVQLLGKKVIDMTNTPDFDFVRKGDFIMCGADGKEYNIDAKADGCMGYTGNICLEIKTNHSGKGWRSGWWLDAEYDYIVFNDEVNCKMYVFNFAKAKQIEANKGLMSFCDKFLPCTYNKQDNCHLQLGLVKIENLIKKGLISASWDYSGDADNLDNVTVCNYIAFEKQKKKEVA